MTQLNKLAVTISILAIASRLILIDQPFIDHWSWRQSDVAAIARNFAHNGFQVAWPQVDWAGDQPGYVGTEFPLLPFLAAIEYKAFGFHEWIGRAQALVFFALSLPFFFLLVRRVFGPTAAMWALFFYSFAPLEMMASRCFMPDVPSLSLAIVGLYYFMRWTEDRQWRSFFASAATISLSILIKATSVVIGLPILYIAVAAVCDRRKASENFEGHPPSHRYDATGRQPLQLLALFAAITLLPSAIWYWHAHQIAQQFYPHHFFGAGGIRGIEKAAWYGKIARLTLTSSLTPLLSALTFIGLLAAPRGKQMRLFHWWLAGMIVFIVAVGYGNRHPWYQLPMVPIAAALAGATCAAMAARISSQTVKTALSILIAGTFGWLAFVYVRPLYQPAAAQFRNAGLELKKITPPSSLIVAADDGNPTIFYYAERKGWHFPEKGGMWQGSPRDSGEAITNLERLRGRGAGYFVLIQDTIWWLDYYQELARHLAITAEMIAITDEFRIYKLHPVEP